MLSGRPQSTTKQAMPRTISATLIPGDGIGPEIIDATLAALDALGAPFEWDFQIAGLAGLLRYPHLYPHQVAGVNKSQWTSLDDKTLNLPGFLEVIGSLRKSVDV